VGEVQEASSTLKHLSVTDFRLSLWLLIEVNSVLGLLHRVVVGDVVDVSEVHAGSIFIVEVCRLMSCGVYV
jgi:hypothetical protein